MTSGKYVGMEIGKRWLDVNVYGTSEVRRYGNDADGWIRLMEWLKEQQPGIVVMEATGGYEGGVA